MGSALGFASQPNPIPEGYIVVNTWPCRFVVPERNRGVVDELSSVCIEKVGSVFGQLGVEHERADGPIEIRVASDPSQMKRLAPVGSSPPTWSDAVAYAKYNLILLSLHRRLGQPIDALDEVLEHELSHLALRKALRGAKVPRWFSEGVAIQQSEHSSFKRYWTLWRAARGDRVIPLRQLEHYPHRPGKVTLAYAEAADFVGYLLRKRGWLGIRIVVRRLSKTAPGLDGPPPIELESVVPPESGAVVSPFEEAIEFAYQRSLRGLEREWLAGLSGRWQWISILTGSGLIWGVTVMLFLLAYVMVRKRRKRRLVEMDREEQLIERRLLPVQNPPKAPVEKVPKAKFKTKIRIDGDIHTLH